MAKRTNILFIILSLILLLPYNPVPVSAESGKLVVIDAGHGGSKPGAVKNGVKESVVNLSIAKKTKVLLEQYGYKVIMTRTDDSNVELSERCKIANDAGADIFVSIHNNSVDSPSAEGTEVLFFPTSTGGKKLAKLIQEELVASIGLKDRGIVERSDLYVLNNTDMPAVIVEGAFISNPEEAKLLATDSFQQLFAQGVTNGIIRYFGGSVLIKRVWMYPNPFSPNRDGKNDVTSFCYSLSQDSRVTIKVFDYKGVVKSVIFNALKKKGRHYEGWTGTNNSGKILPNGNYRYEIYVTSGKQKFTVKGITAIKNPIPRLSSVWMHPNPFSPNKDGKKDTTSFCYSIASDAYVTIRVYDHKGEVRAVINNALRKKGRHYEGWTGTNNLGKVLPKGNYRYNIVATKGIFSFSKSGITGLQ